LNQFAASANISPRMRVGGAKLELHTLLPSVIYWLEFLDLETRDLELCYS